VRVREGRADLLELLPSLESIGRAAYVQLVYYEQPVGPALVVEPLLSPMWPRTEVQIERGARRTVITGWEVQPPGPDGHPPLEEEAPDADERPTADTGGETTAREAADAGIRRLLDRRGRRCSGFRSYVEQDVRLETTEGTLRVALRPDEAPATAWNFRRLAAGGLYDGLPFHRVVPVDREGRPFVIQGGDPAGDGEGGPGERIAMEPSALEHDFGVVSMARDDHPDSAGSQFFIALSRAGTARLDGQYCAFGAVVAGAPVIRAIAATELADPATGRPADPPMVVSAELVPAPPRIPTVGRPDRLVRPDDELEPRPVTPKRVPR